MNQRFKAALKIAFGAMLLMTGALLGLIYQIWNHGIYPVPVPFAVSVVLVALYWFLYFTRPCPGK